MASSPGARVFLGSRLQVDDLKSLSEIVLKLESDASIAKQITTIEVNEKEPDETELDAGGDPPIIPPEVYEKFGIDMSRIIDQIHQNGGLETFRWNIVDQDDQENTRPEVFWQSLWQAATSLKNLNLDFSVHKLQKLSKSNLILPQVQFPVLETLTIDATFLHGDDGSLIETILHSSSAIQDLKLSFPTCDLENCRLQGITWQYTLPPLQTLDLTTYINDNAALSDFLLRHPKITTLAWDVDADEEFIFPENSLPKLRALSMEFRGGNVKANVEALAKCEHLAHLRVNGFPHAGYPHLAKLESLKCLELLPTIWSWRKGSGRTEKEPDSDDERRTAALEAELEAETGFRNLPDIIRSMLGKMNGLQELAINLETSNSCSRDHNGVFRRPVPMDVRDLKSVINILPKDTQIRALRVTDKRGLKLPDDLLDNFPEVPARVEYLKWEIGEEGEKGSLYRLERKGGRVQAVECEALRKLGGKKSWVDERILDY